MEIFLNGKSLGKKTMETNSHLEWQIKYEPGTLLAKGFKAGKEIAIKKVETIDQPAAIQLLADRASIKSDSRDASVITVQVNDAKGRLMPIASNEITFALEGPGKIVGVGNGDPSCHEPDVFVANRPVRTTAVSDWKWKVIADPRSEKIAEIAADFDDSSWEKCDVKSEDGPMTQDQNSVFRAYITVSQSDLAAEMILLSFGKIDEEGWIYVNGNKLGQSRDWQASPTFDVKTILHPGKNTIAATVANKYGQGGVNRGVTLQFQEKPIIPQWKRSVFNGLAQVIVKSTEQTRPDYPDSRLQRSEVR